MSNSAAFAGASAASSAVAAAAAHRAMVERCKAEIVRYDPRTANVTEMQSYADCVHAVYPKDMAGPELVIAKIAVALALVGAAGGAWKANKDYCAGIFEWFMFAAMGAIMLPAGVGFIAALLYGAHWILT